MFGVLRNKYLLINTIVGLIDSLGNGMLAITQIVYLYTFRLSGLPYTIIVNLISFAGTPPDLCAPFFLKRFDYKQIMIFYQQTRAFGNALLVGAFWFFADNVHICGLACIIVMFLMEMTKTIPTTAGHDMGTRIGDPAILMFTFPGSRDLLWPFNLTSVISAITLLIKVSLILRTLL